MHASVYDWIARQVADLDLADASVLDVGSRDVNGSVRPLFGGPYTGVDMLEGRGVDLVANAHDLPYPANAFDVALCTEMLEHDDRPWLTVIELARVASAHVLVTVRGYDQHGYFPVHDYPEDLWRYSAQGLLALLRWARLDVQDLVPDPEAPGVFAHALGDPKVRRRAGTMTNGRR